MAGSAMACKTSKLGGVQWSQHFMSAAEIGTLRENAVAERR
jgi:hypothetical protein